MCPWLSRLIFLTTFSTQNTDEEVDPIPGMGDFSAKHNSYTLVLDDVGNHIVVECMPMSTEGAPGAATGVESPVPVQPGIPTAKNVKLEGAFAFGKVVSCSFTYWGGRPGKSKYQWKRVERAPSASLFTHPLHCLQVKEGRESSIQGANQPSYTVIFDDAECILACEVTPVREDGVEGPRVTASVFFSCFSFLFFASHMCMSQATPSQQIDRRPPSGSIVDLNETAKEGDLLQPQVDYQGGNEGRHSFRWYRRTGAGGSAVPISEFKLFFRLSFVTFFSL